MLNPLIFTKKTFFKPQKLTPQLLALENVLAMVCKLYYKSNFRLEDYLAILNKEDQVADDDTRIAPNKPKKKELNVVVGGGIGTTMLRKRRPEEDNLGEDDINGGQTVDEAGDSNKAGEQVFVSAEGGLSILERLVSPILPSFEFGRSFSSRKLVSERHRDLRVQFVFLWQRLRKNEANGKQRVTKLGRRKGHSEIAAFYQEWQGSSHYKIYKHHRK